MTETDPESNLVSICKCRLILINLFKASNLQPATEHKISVKFELLHFNRTVLAPSIKFNATSVQSLTSSDLGQQSLYYIGFISLLNMTYQHVILIWIPLSVVLIEIIC